MEQYSLSLDFLPRFFYRVQYAGSQTFYNEAGLSAKGKISSSPIENEFKEIVTEAFVWGSNVASLFIIVFSERNHAENRALKWLDKEGERNELVTVESCKLENVAVFKVSTPVDKLEINLRDGALQHKEGAYLCLHRVPARAVCTSERLSSIEASKIGRIRLSVIFFTGNASERVEAFLAREEFINHTIKRPGTHWNSESHGYYDTDEEVEANNTNDDLMKIMEGDWN